MIGDHVDDPSDYKETHNILGDAKSLNNPITRRAKTFGESASFFLSQLIFCSSFLQTDSLQQFITVNKSEAYLYFFFYLLVGSMIVKEEIGLILLKIIESYHKLQRNNNHDEAREKQSSQERCIPGTMLHQLSKMAHPFRRNDRSDQFSHLNRVLTT